MNIVSYEIFKHVSLEKADGVPDVWLHASSGERLGSNRFPSVVLYFALANREDVGNFQRRLEAALTNNDYQKDPYRRELSFRSISNIMQRVLYYMLRVPFTHAA